MGCLRYQGASTIGSPLLLETGRLLPLLANPGNRAMSPYAEGDTGTRHTELTVERGREGRGMLEDVLPSKTTLTVNTIAVKAANTSQSETWSPRACTYQNTADTYRNAGALCC